MSRAGARGRATVAAVVMALAAGAVTAPGCGGAKDPGGGGGTSGGAGGAGAGTGGASGGVYLSFKESGTLLAYTLSPAARLSFGPASSGDQLRVEARGRSAATPDITQAANVIINRPSGSTATTFACGDTAIFNYGLDIAFGAMLVPASSCTVTLARWPTTLGTLAEGTFSGALDDGTMLTEGRFAVPLSEISGGDAGN